MKRKRFIGAFLLVAFVMTVCCGCNSDKNIETKPGTTDNMDSSEMTQLPTNTVASTADEGTTNSTAVETTDTSVETTAVTTDPVTEETTESTQQQTAPPQVANPFAPTPLAGALPESGSVDSSFFNDAVFVGDSVSLKLSYYEAAVDKLGTAQFLTSGSLGSGNALWEVSGESVHPTYDGIKMRLDESIPLTGAKKMYIMLGMNDIAIYGIDGAVANMVTLIQQIQAAVPDIVVYVQTMTPITDTSNILSSGGHNPQNIHRYNEALATACQTHGWKFVNVAEVMYGQDGYLRRDYCSDPDGMGIHFTEAGCEAWISYLYTHTG